MRLHVYADLRGRWRWRIVAVDGRIVGEGPPSGCDTRTEALLEAYRVGAGMPVVEDDVVDLRERPVTVDVL